VMAYTPLESGQLESNSALKKIAKRHDAAPLQIALAWVLHQDNVIAIPKAARLEHVRANRMAADIVLRDDDLDALDGAFAPPSGPRALEML
ncbi:MAG: aldo/keto reductase, partial [Gammaproteobacteria bacterium]